MVNRRDDLRKRDPTSPELPRLNKTIQNRICVHKRQKLGSQGTSYQPISLIYPAAKVLESLFLPSINKYLIPAQDQHGFRREHSTTSALLQLTTDVAVGFNQRKPPDRTVCVAVDLLPAFDTVCHNNLLSKPRLVLEE